MRTTQWKSTFLRGFFISASVCIVQVTSGTSFAGSFSAAVLSWRRQISRIAARTGIGCTRKPWARCVSDWTWSLGTFVDTAWNCERFADIDRRIPIDFAHAFRIHARPGRLGGLTTRPDHSRCAYVIVSISTRVWYSFAVLNQLRLPTILIPPPCFVTLAMTTSSWRVHLSSTRVLLKREWETGKGSNKE